MLPENDVERITKLEEKNAHLEKTFSELNDVVIQQQKRIERLEMLLQRTDDQIERIHAVIDERRSAADERPPHY